MGRAYGILLALTGYLLIALGVWVLFRFEKVPVPDAPPPVSYAVQRHPAAGAGGELVIAGALCLAAAAMGGRVAGIAVLSRPAEPASVPDRRDM